MPWPRITWRNGASGGTAIDEQNLNRIEDGIAGAHEGVESVQRDTTVALNEIRAALENKANDASRWIPAADFAGGTLTTVPGTTVPALSFTATADLAVSALLDLPNEWPNRAYVQLLWAPGDGDAGDTAWRVGVQNYEAASVLGPPAYAAQVVQSAGGVASTVRQLNAGAVTANPQVITNLVIEARGADAADTYTGTRYLLGVRMLKDAPVLPPDESTPPPVSGEIAATLLTTAFNDANQTSYTTASVSPAANRLLLLAIASGSTSDSLTAPLPTPTGLGLTWTQILTEPFSSDMGVRRLTWWRATTGGSAPTPGTITIDMGGETSVVGAWGLVEVSGANATTPILQPKTQEGATSGPITTSMSAPLNSYSRVFAAFLWRTQENATPEAGWTELWDTPGTSPSLGFVGAWLPNGFDTSPYLGITGGDWAIGAFEVASASSVVEPPDEETPGGGTPAPVGGFAANEQNDGGPRTADLVLRAAKSTPVGLYTTRQDFPAPASNTTFDLRQARFRGFFFADSVYGFGEWESRTATSHELNFQPIRVGTDTPATGALLLGGIIEGDQNPNLTWNSMKHGSHIQAAIDGGQTGDQAWALIVDNQNMDGDARIYIAANSFAVVAGLRTRHTMDGFGVYGPEGSDTRLGDGTLYVRNCWFTDVHDDGIENDRQRKLIITDCLFERVYTWLSTRAPDESGSPQAHKTIQVKDSVVWLHPRNGPYKQPSTSVKHDLIYKHQTNSPGISLKNVIIAASAPRSSNSLTLPTRSGLDSYENVRIVWMGSGSYPGNVPAGVTVTTDQTVLTNAVADWKRRHGVTDFETVNMDRMLSPELPSGATAPPPPTTPTEPTPPPPGSGTPLSTPGLIDGIEPEAHSHHPVYADANGMLYRVTEEYTSAARHNEPRMMKSTNQGASWTEMDASGRSTHNDLEGGWCTQSTGVIHYCWNDGSRMSYSAFGTSDNPVAGDRDRWIVQREDFSTGMSAGSQQYSSMTRTSNGQIWFFFADTVSGSNRQIAYCRRTGPASYTSNTKIGTTSENNTNPVSTLGAGDVTHLFYNEFNSRQLRYRTLTTGGTLSAAVRPDTTGTGSRAFPLTKPVYYDNGGVENIVVGFRNAAGEFKSIQVTNGVVGAEQLINAGPVTQSPTGSGNDGGVCHLAVRGTTVYAIWANATSGDVFYASRAHGGSWSAATKLWDSGSNECWWVYNNCLTLAGVPYMYYTYDIAPHADGDSNITVNRVPL